MQENLFDEFHTIIYDQKSYSTSFKTFELYEANIKKSKADGSTSFVPVFIEIMNLAKTKNIDDLSVIFFTDGCDTCNNKSQIEGALANMKKQVSEIPSRFLTIGFTSGHDALFMNKISQAGTELGNFYYIDT